jgi:hypothetical protein
MAVREACYEKGRRVEPCSESDFRIWKVFLGAVYTVMLLEIVWDVVLL